MLGGLLVMAVLSSCRAVIGIEEKRFEQADGGGQECGADLASDEENCGACGQSCLGGDCIQGVCQPVPFAVGGKPQSIVLDDERVFWTDLASAELRSLRKDSTDPEVLLTLDAQHRPERLARSGSTLVLSVYNPEDPSRFGPGWIARIQTDGSGYAELATAPNGPWTVTTDGETVFFVQRWGPDALASVPLAGGEPETLIPWTASYDEALGLVVDDHYVMYASFAYGTIQRLPKRGGTVEVVFDGPPMTALTVSGDQLYFSADGGLWRAPLADPSAPELIAPISARALEVVGGVVHYAATDHWGRVNVDGTELTVIMDTELGDSIASDDEAVYYADQFGGVIWRLARQ